MSGDIIPFRRDKTMKEVIAQNRKKRIAEEAKLLAEIEALKKKLDGEKK